jgi:hypothetical protein
LVIFVFALSCLRYRFDSIHKLLCYLHCHVVRVQGSQKNGQLFLSHWPPCSSCLHIYFLTAATAHLWSFLSWRSLLSRLLRVGLILCSGIDNPRLWLLMLFHPLKCAFHGILADFITDSCNLVPIRRCSRYMESTSHMSRLSLVLSSRRAVACSIRYRDSIHSHEE